MGDEVASQIRRVFGGQANAACNTSSFRLQDTLESVRLGQANRPHIRGSLVNAIAFGVHWVTLNHYCAAGARMLMLTTIATVNLPPGAYVLDAPGVRGRQIRATGEGLEVIAHRRAGSPADAANIAIRGDRVVVVVDHTVKAGASK
jgi:hypothetical protein